MYKLSKSDLELLNQILLTEDLNPPDRYEKSVVIKAIQSEKELTEDELIQIRNYVMDKNLEYGFELDGEPNDFGYATEELADKFYDVLEAYY